MDSCQAGKELETFYDELFGVMEKFASVFYQWFTQIEAIKELCGIFADCIWDAYDDAGMPYGETPDGMWKWVHERTEIERLRREAENLETYHKQMADFRKMVREKQNG